MLEEPPYNRSALILSSTGLLVGLVSAVVRRGCKDLDIEEVNYKLRFLNILMPIEI